MRTKIVDYLLIFIFLVECSQYKNLTDADRKYGHNTTGQPKCDNKLNGWYRFQGDAGRKMMTTCPLINKCGGNYTAWLRDGHPTVAQGSVSKKVCINKKSANHGGDCCDESYSIRVENCGSYFIYMFQPESQASCCFRYCGTD